MRGTPKKMSDSMSGKKEQPAPAGYSEQLRWQKRGKIRKNKPQFLISRRIMGKLAVYWNSPIE
jgi:hypothetical protein